MQTVEQTEFTNRNKDRVSIVLLQDSFNGFHLIVKVSRLRNHPEMRHVGNAFIEIPTSTFAKETKHIQLPTKGSALNEFNLYRVTEGDPDFNMAQYSEWQKANLEMIQEEGK